MSRIWKLSILIAVVLGLGLGQAAWAVLTDSGGTIIRRTVRTETTASTSSSTAFVNVPNTNVSVTVPANTTRLVLARFTAESQCVGGAAGNWCSMQIIARESGGAVVALNPASGLDFAFDAVNSPDDFWESNSMARSARLGPGTWSVFAQRAVTNTATVFRLDDWTFELDVST